MQNCSLFSTELYSSADSTKQPCNYKQEADEVKPVETFKEKLALLKTDFWTTLKPPFVALFRNRLTGPAREQ